MSDELVTVEFERGEAEGILAAIAKVLELSTPVDRAQADAALLLASGLGKLIDAVTAESDPLGLRGTHRAVEGVLGGMREHYARREAAPLN